jgi:hypothetical protein
MRCSGDKRIVQWVGDVPRVCDVCGAELRDVFVDCLTVDGVFGFLCVSCAGELAVSAHPRLCQIFQWAPAGWFFVID